MIRFIRGTAMDAKQIIMNYTTPPGLDDFATLADMVLQSLPEELEEQSEDLQIVIDDFPDDAVQADLDLDDAYELLALYRKGSEVSPGIEKKEADDDDTLFLYRRPILDVWCENCEDITSLIREVIIEEIGKALNFSEEEIDEMTSRHHQHLL